METNCRKIASRRARGHIQGLCWYGSLARSLARCTHASNRGQRRKSH